MAHEGFSIPREQHHPGDLGAQLFPLLRFLFVGCNQPHTYPRSLPEPVRFQSVHGRESFLRLQGLWGQPRAK